LFTLDAVLQVLDVQGGFDLCLVDTFLELLDLLVLLVRLLCELILSAAIVVADLLNFVIKFLFLKAKLLKLILLLDLTVNVIVEVLVRKVFQLAHQGSQPVD